VIILSFLFFLGVFVAIGISSNRLAQPSRRSYLLADQNVSPWLVGLSAVATNNSGYMFIGVIGYTYVTGLAATWLMFGWILGDLVASSFVHRRLREASESGTSNTFPSLLAGWYGQNHSWVRRIAGVIVVIFLGTYAAAQLSAGSKTLYVLFDWPLYAGAMIGAGIVLLYCLAGGIRASIWTDAAQSVVMLVAMVTLLYASIDSLGGLESTWYELGQVSPEYLQLFPPDLSLGSFYGPLLFAAGWLFAGFSVIGQPHVMIRFMAINRQENINKARLYYYLWFTAFYFTANGVALTSRALLPETAGFDPELALPTIAIQLLHPALVGLVLAGIFAATMSTADSLILSCAGSLSEDLVKLPNNIWIPKLATIAVTAFALWLALTETRSVFDLVISSWAVLAASFAPLIFVLCLGRRPSQGLALVMMVSGLIAVYGWTQVDMLSAYYEGTLGIMCGFAVFLIGKALGFDGAGRGNVTLQAELLAQQSIDK
jgi:sodium/proline symporter